MIEYLIVLLILIIMETIYLKIAPKFDVIDIPNSRSSHKNIVVRGGGIVIPMSLILYSIYYGKIDLFIIGFIIISFVSFIDDISGVSNKWRFLTQLIVVILLLISVYSDIYQVWFLLILLILSIGTINAVNFMDGINGITVAFGTVFLATLIYLNIDIKFVDQRILAYAGIGILTFALFNFRSKALCFGGDVGSISLGYLLVYFSLLYYQKTESFSVLAFWLVYGIDSVITIVYRLIKKENIFIAHRSHLYQYIANELNVSHIKISIAYGLAQAIVNVIVIYNLNAHVVSQNKLLLLLILSMGMLYIIIRTKVLRKISVGVE